MSRVATLSPLVEISVKGAGGEVLGTVTTRRRPAIGRFGRLVRRPLREIMTWPDAPYFREIDFARSILRDLRKSRAS